MGIDISGQRDGEKSEVKESLDSVTDTARPSVELRVGSSIVWRDSRHKIVEIFKMTTRYKDVVDGEDVVSSTFHCILDNGTEVDLSQFMDGFYILDPQLPSRKPQDREGEGMDEAFRADQHTHSSPPVGNGYKVLRALTAGLALATMTNLGGTQSSQPGLADIPVSTTSAVSAPEKLVPARKPSGKGGSGKGGSGKPGGKASPAASSTSSTKLDPSK